MSTSDRSLIRDALYYQVDLQKVAYEFAQKFSNILSMNKRNERVQSKALKFWKYTEMHGSLNAVANSLCNSN